MEVYILLISIIILLGCFVAKKQKRIYCIIIGLLLLLLIGCRNQTMGIYDTERIYIPTYNKIKKIDIFELQNYYNKDIAFHYITKIFIMFIDNPQLWLAFVALPFILGTVILIYKYSNNPIMSFILLLSLNFFGMSFTLIRHYIALGFILFSYEYLKEKEIKKFIISILIAGLFHKTALLFLVAYPLFHSIKFGKKSYLIIVISFIFSILLGRQFLNFIIEFINEERFYIYLNSNSSLNLTNFVINFIILISLNLYIKIFYNDELKPEINGLLNLATFSCICLIFTPILGEMYRLAMYFNIFYIILIPNVISGPTKNLKAQYLIHYLFYIISILYFLFFSLENAKILPYKFFIK